MASCSIPTWTAKKGGNWTPTPKAALLFYWKSLRRQVRIRGTVERVTDAEADAYFATRPKQAQIGAWASKQSAPLESRLAFEKAVARLCRQIRARRGAAPAAIGRVIAHRADLDRVLARPAVPPARSDRIPRERLGGHGARRGSIRELVSRHSQNKSWHAESQTNQPRRTLLLTGASRGIGHATVKRFSAAGWRVITCSRHAFPENCPWEMGPEDHIQVDLADPKPTRARSPRSSTGSTTASCTRWSTTRRSRPRPRAARLSSIDTTLDVWQPRVSGEFLRADHAGARPDRRAQAAPRARW